MEPVAVLLIQEVTKALDNGTLHFRKSDNKLLSTPLEIIETLVSEGEIIFEPVKNGRVQP